MALGPIYCGKPLVRGHAESSFSGEPAWMTVSPSFRNFILEQLGRSVQGILGRNMFGGVGIYGGELFFALIADDTSTSRPTN